MAILLVGERILVEQGVRTGLTPQAAGLPGHRTVQHAAAAGDIGPIPPAAARRVWSGLSDRRGPPGAR